MNVATAFTRSDEPNEIVRFAHCAKCLAERPANISPRNWAKLEVGYTQEGVQVWCKRHDVNVVHLKWAKDSYEPDGVQP